MRIAIDASRTTVARVTGTEHYARALIRALIEANDSHHLTLYFRDAPPPDLFPQSARVRHKIIPLRRLWTHARFAAALWHDRPDITFVPAHTLPFVFPGTAAVTVHDLGYKLFPQAHPAKDRRYLDLTTRTSAARASVIFADSQATAADLTRFYGTPPHKIRVVYPGVNAPPIGDLRSVREKYHLPNDYFLFIGTLQPRKNIARLVQAYRLYREQGGQSALVLAGGKGWLYEDAWIANAPDVYRIGYVDEADKGALYAAARALVFPSLYEGFGFPVLEAMLCGTPVIASNTSSLPELVGEAGLLIDPLDVRAIAAAMQYITPDRERGIAQARRFTWDSAARAVLSALEAHAPQK